MRFFISFLSALLVLLAPFGLVAADETVYSTSTSTHTVTMTIIHSVAAATPSAMPTTMVYQSSAPYPTSMVTKPWPTGTASGTVTGGMPVPTGSIPTHPPINGAASLPINFATALVAGSVALLLGAAL